MRRLRKSCLGCEYYKNLGTSPGLDDLACHYFLETGKLRPCPADKCTVKATQTKRRKKQSFDHLYKGGAA